MFLLQRIDLIALMGLFVQAFVAWVFVAILARVRRGESTMLAFRDFHHAFLALAISLTVLSVRFFQTHELRDPDSTWSEGGPAATACYILYLGLKALFGLLLVRGSYLLAGRESPRWLSRAWWPVVVLTTSLPLWTPNIVTLLVAQAPLMIACSIAALLVLPRPAAAGSGLQLVRLALMGTAAAWCVHALAASLFEVFPLLRYALALNSFVDLAVQLALGTGLLVSLLQAAHQRLSAAEQERAQLQRRLDRDEKLRALGTLVSGVAHELNNPLTVIMGYAEMLSTPGREHAAARIVGEQAERCRVIVRSLSALAGQVKHRPQELLAEELVERVLRGLAPKASPEGRRVRVEPIGELRLHADRVGMEQVLTNLILNALQASPPRGEVLVRASARPEGIEFRVSDGGPGVPQELRSRLFEPFFTTKEPGQGTGLGLSIADAIVREHGGTITIEDAPAGRGACFCVLIPHAPRASVPESAPATPPRCAGRLLIVDDDAAVRSVLRLQAERRGWSVSECDRAEGVLSPAAWLSEADAVLCDLRMPGIGGIGLHDRLAREDPQALERIVFVTGDLASEESARFSQRCKHPLIAKPFDFDELFAIVARVARAELQTGRI